jgi:hypothetical protein
MQITDIQGDKLTELVALGYKIRRIHMDGVVDMGKVIDGDMVLIFINPNGDIRPPRTHSTMIAGVELHEAGIRTVMPRQSLGRTGENGC